LRDDAEQDLWEILTFIARDSRRAAESVAFAIDRTLTFLSENPLLGQPVTGTKSQQIGLRKKTVKQYRVYIVAYLPPVAGLRDYVDVLRILDSRRNVSDLL